MNTNLNKTLIFPAVIIAALSLSSAVFAQNNYVGIGFVSGGFDYDGLCGDDESDIVPSRSKGHSYQSSCVLGVSGSKIYAGAGGSNNLVLEFGYVDFGETVFQEEGTTPDGGPRFIDETLEFSTIYLAAVGIFPISESWDLSTKFGLHSYDVVYGFSSNRPDNKGLGDTSGTDLLYGIGLQWHNANGFGVRGEWESFGMEWEYSDETVPIDLSSSVRFDIQTLLTTVGDSQTAPYSGAGQFPADSRHE